MRQDDHKRLDRLAGDGNGAAGIDLAALFRVILNQLQDSPDAIPDAAAFAGPVRAAVSNHARVDHLYGASPWPALIADALSQLESRNLASQDGEGWHTGPAFATGQRMVVVPARKGKHGSVGVTLYPAAERAARGEAEKRRMEITSLAASLREDSPGLRPVNSEHVDTLTQSMRDNGYRPEFPILIDQHGRVLDGRHRREAARRAGIEPLSKTVRVQSDEEAVGLAILMNLQRGWTKAERAQLDSILQSAGLSLDTYGQHLGAAAKRERIRGALLASPKLSHNAVAKRLGYANSGPMIKQACDALIIENIISECRHRLTEDGKQAPGPKPGPGEPRQLKRDNPALHADIRQRVEEGKPVGVQELADKHGIGFGTVQIAEGKVRERMTAEREAVSDTDAAAWRKVAEPSWQRVFELYSKLPAEGKAAFRAAQAAEAD